LIINLNEGEQSNQAVVIFYAWFFFILSFL
jgi:hypothetical protein